MHGAAYTVGESSAQESEYRQNPAESLMILGTVNREQEKEDNESGAEEDAEEKLIME